jgi:hypothetical protein
VLAGWQLQSSARRYFDDLDCATVTSESSHLTQIHTTPTWAVPQYRPCFSSAADWRVNMHRTRLLQNYCEDASTGRQDQHMDCGPCAPRSAAATAVLWTQCRSGFRRTVDQNPTSRCRGQGGCSKRELSKLQYQRSRQRRCTCYWQASLLSYSNCSGSKESLHNLQQAA